MSIRCSKCKREYDVTLFEFEREIVCECGNRSSGSVVGSKKDAVEFKKLSRAGVRILAQE